MTNSGLLSIMLNVALGALCVLLVFRAHYDRVAYAAELQISRGEAKRSLATVEQMQREYLSLARSVALTLNEIRQDIDRNYRHTHEAHLLDRIAYMIEKAGRPIRMDGRLEDDIRAVGGLRFIVDGELLFSGALALAWHLHTEARRRADALFPIVRQTCGHTDRAAWLSKTLAMYERICDGDKMRAISSLENVLECWRHNEIGDAARWANW